MESSSQSSRLRHLLGTLLAFGTVNALAGGYYGLSGAEGVPTDWLEGSPFRDYTIPSLILVVVVGGSLLVATILVFARSGLARTYALSAGAILMIWLAVQIAIIGYVSWMQPATAVGAVLILLMARRLPPSASSIRVS